MPDLFISSEQAEKDLLACAAFLGERSRSSTGHAEAMRSVVPHYLGRGEVDLAAELANAVDDPFSRDKLLISVAAKCAELDDDEYALQLADAIEDHGLQGEAFERIAFAKVEKGNIEKAMSVAGMMAHPDAVLAAAAVRQSADGESEAAEKTLGSIEYETARTAALQEMARQQLSADDKDGAVATLTNALDSATEIEHPEERIRALCDTGTLFAEAGDSGRSIDAFTRAREAAEGLDNIHRDFFFVNCALGFLYTGDEARADEALDLVADKTQMASALLGFAREYWEKERRDDALDTLDEAHEILRSQRDIETRDSRATHSLLASIAVQFAAFGKYDRATEAALQNPVENEKAAALSQIAQAMTLDGEDALARQTLELIDQDSDRLFALIGIADAKRKLGDDAGSRNFLNEAAQLAEAVPQLAARSSVLNGLAVRFVEHGEQEKAQVLALENLGVIAEMRDESSQAAALANLAEVFAMTGLEVTDAARQTLESLIRRAELAG